MRILAIAALTAVLGGCSGSIIKKEMNKLQGQPLSAVVARLGVPTEERQIAGNKVYVWFNRSLMEGTELKCQIRVIMKGDVIGSWDFEGNEARCQRYADELLRN